MFSFRPDKQKGLAYKKITRKPGKTYKQIALTTQVYVFTQTVSANTQLIEVLELHL